MPDPTNTAPATVDVPVTLTLTIAGHTVRLPVKLTVDPAAWSLEFGQDDTANDVRDYFVHDVAVTPIVAHLDGIVTGARVEPTK